METGYILVGVISMIAIIIPFVYMYRKSKKTERGLVKNLKVYADANGFQVDKSEAVAQLVLGLDNQNKLAFFSEVDEGTYETKHIDLSNISICKVNREVREVDYHGEKDRITHRLEIEFYPKNRKDEMTAFLLFDEDDNRMLSGEIQLANEWVAHYNSLLKQQA
ncbi:MAG TPA: hypothetical protein VFD77_03460 [Brumimicrobium sp.]|nr:hypothetical protein [Brumimicrobium sp.]